MKPTQDGDFPGSTLAPGDRGATAAEYAIMASAIAAVIVVAVAAVGTETLGLFQGLLDVWP